MSPKIITLYGPLDSSRKLRDWKKARILPNPWPPNDIEALIVIASTTAGLASVAYKLIKLWVDDRGARKIKIKKGDIELEIEGGMGTKKIERVFGQFRKLTRGKKGDVRVILPRSIDRSLPLESHNQKKASKKGGKRQ